MSASIASNRLLTGLVSSALALSMAGMLGCSSQPAAEDTTAGSAAAAPAAGSNADVAGEASFLEQGYWVIERNEDPDFGGLTTYEYSDDGEILSMHSEYDDENGNTQTLDESYSDFAADGSYSFTSSDSSPAYDDQAGRIARTYFVDEDSLTATLVTESTLDDGTELFAQSINCTFYADGTLKSATNAQTSLGTDVDDEGNPIGEPYESTTIDTREFDEHGNLISFSLESEDGVVYTSYAFEYVYDEEGNPVSATRTAHYDGDDAADITEYTFDTDDNGNITGVYVDGQLWFTYTWRFVEHPTALTNLSSIGNRYVMI